MEDDEALKKRHGGGGVGGTSLVVQWLGLRLPMQTVWIQSLVRKLRSHMGPKKPKHLKKKKFQDIGMSRREASIWGGEKGWDFSFGHFESEVSLGHPVVCALQVGVGSGVGRKTYQEEKILTATARN